MNSEQLEVLKRRKYLEYLKLLPSIREEKAKAYLTLAFTFAAISIFGFFAINPTLSTISQLHKQLDDLRQIKAALEQKSSNISRLESEYMQLENDFSLLMNVTPLIPNAPYLLGQLQALAGKNGVTISSMQSLQVDLEKQRKEGTESSFVFTIEAEGPYDRLLQMVNDSATFNRLITFEKVEMSNIISNTGVKVTRLSIRARAYFKP